MRGPIDLEWRYRELVSILRFSSSPRERLYRIKGFIDGILGYGEDAESYLMELIQQYAQQSAELDVLGIDPRELRSLYDTATDIDRVFPSLSDVAGFSESMNRLKLYTARQCAYAGDYRAMLSILFPPYTQRIPHLVGTAAAGRNASPRELLDRIISAAEQNNDPVRIPAKQIADIWYLNSAARRDTVIVPIAEQSYDKEFRESAYGTSLQVLRITIFGKSRTRKDEINPIQLPATAARSLISKTHPNLGDRYVRGQIAARHGYTKIEDASLNAAMAALAYCSILGFFKPRITYRLNKSIAILGDVSEDGFILPVSDESLSRMIRAVAFSPVEYLVAPKCQADDAERIITEIRKDYPKRTLPVIGIERLQEIMYDRRITEKLEFNRLMYSANRLRSHVTGTRGMVAFIVLCLLFLRLVYGPIDRNPVDGEYRGPNLVLENKFGFVVENIPIGDQTMARMGYRSDEGQSLSDHFILYDVTGDGFNEVIWYVHPFDREFDTAVIYCKSPRQDRIIWERPIDLEFSFPRKPYASTAHLSVKSMWIDDLHGNGDPALIVVGQHVTFFAGFVLIIDPVTGEIGEYYLNSGGLRSGFSHDITGNGVKEIIAGGVNNAFEEAVVIVLDAEFKTGHSPVQGDYIVAGMPRAREISYISFPRTAVGRILVPRTRYNRIDSILHDVENRSIEVFVTEYADRTPPDEISHISSVRYIVSFDYDLSVRSVRPTEQFDLMAEYLYLNGVLPDIPDERYFQEYARKIRYMTGGQ